MRAHTCARAGHGVRASPRHDAIESERVSHCVQGRQHRGSALPWLWLLHGVRQARLGRLPLPAQRCSSQGAEQAWTALHARARMGAEVDGELPCSADRWRAAAPTCRRRVRPACVCSAAGRCALCLQPARCGLTDGLSIGIRGRIIDEQARSALHRWSHRGSVSARCGASCFATALSTATTWSRWLDVPLFVPGREQAQTLSSTHEWMCAVPTGHVRTRARPVILSPGDPRDSS
jgi:hypothetical protein